MRKVKQAIRDVGEAARKGDMEQARTALTGLGEAIGSDKAVRQIVERVQQAVSDVGGQVRQAMSGQTGSALRLAPGAAAVVLPVCATLVQAGRLARERGTTLELRNLGERLAVQFDQIGSQLREVGREMPQGMDETGRNLMASLSDLSGNLFDQAFADEAMNAVIRILDALPEQAGGLGTQLRQLEGNLRELADTIHHRERTLPGPGTTEAVEKDRGIA
jgi:hypothetical protein